MNKENTCCLDCYWENPDRTEKEIEDCSNVKCHCHKRSQCNDCFDGDHKCAVSECECWCKVRKYNYIEDPLGRAQKVFKQEEKKCEWCSPNSKPENRCASNSPQSDTWEEEFIRSEIGKKLTMSERQWIILHFRPLIQKEREEGYRQGTHYIIGGPCNNCRSEQMIRTDTITEILGIVKNMEEDSPINVEHPLYERYCEDWELENEILSNLKEKLSELIKKQ